MIVVGGDNLIDMLQSDRTADEITFAGMRGGSAYNTARAIGLQSQRVGYITPISTDSLGDFLADKILADGAELLSDRLPNPSSLAVVTLTNGQAGYQFYRQGTAERMVDTAMLASNTPGTITAFHLTSLGIVEGADADAWADHYEAQRQAGVLTTLDPNVRPLLIDQREQYLARLNRLFANTGLLKLSDEDLEWIYPDLGFDAACQAVLAATSAALTVVTKGGDGAVAFHKDGPIDIPAAPVDTLVDTVGAGDTFMGTLLSELSRRGALNTNAVAALSSDDVLEIITTAAFAAAINCGRKGCQPPTDAELN